LVEVTLQDLPHLSLDDAPLRDLLVDELLQRRFHDGPRILDQPFRFPHVDETARDDVGTGHHFTGLLIEGDDHDQDAVLGELLAIPQDDIADVPDAQTVYEDLAVGYRA